MKAAVPDAVLRCLDKLVVGPAADPGLDIRGDVRASRVPNGVWRAPPPANGWPPFAVWQAAQSPAIAM